MAMVDVKVNEESLYRGGKVSRLSSKESDLVFQALAWEKEDRKEEDVDDQDSHSGYNYDAFEDDGDRQQYDEPKRRKKVTAKNFVIRTFGITEDGRTVSLEILGFRPYFYLKIPIKWGPSQLRLLINRLKGYVPFYREKEVVFDPNPVISKTLYGFDDFADHKFLKISFKSDGARWDLMKALRDDEFNQVSHSTDIRPAMTKEIRLAGGARYRFPLYESTVDSIIRFIDLSEIKPTGWIKINQAFLRPASEKTQCQLNYGVRWDQVKPHDKSEIAPFRITSYDIECTSCDGSFPQSQRRSDAVIQIGTTTRTFGSKYCQIRHIVCLKECDPIPNITHEEEDDELVIVESYPTEKEVLLAWTKHIQKIDPDVIIGYNIFGFDWKYLYDRAEMMRCSD
jgi:DNA polymerase delta subunit 1